MNAHERYRKTKKGQVNKIYSNQRTLSKKRGHQPPGYTKEELREWLFSQDEFHRIFDAWLASGCDSNKAPSVDRINDYMPYAFGNIQLVTWGDNARKAFTDRKEGRNNKRSIAVLQYSMDGVLIREFHSAMEAGRTVGTSGSHILNCCRGKHQHISGYVWKLAGGSQCQTV